MSLGPGSLEAAHSGRWPLAPPPLTGAHIRCWRIPLRWPLIRLQHAQRCPKSLTSYIILKQQQRSGAKQTFGICAPQPHPIVLASLWLLPFHIRQPWTTSPSVSASSSRKWTLIRAWVTKALAQTCTYRLPRCRPAVTSPDFIPLLSFCCYGNDTSPSA